MARRRRPSRGTTRAALAREIETLTEEVRRLSRVPLTDSLTGRGNRRGSDERPRSLTHAPHR